MDRLKRRETEQSWCEIEHWHWDYEWRWKNSLTHWAPLWLKMVY